MNYRDSFKAAGSAAAYETREYDTNSSAAILWVIESATLDRVIDALVLREGSYLDFACGTGRVLNHVSKRMTRSVGIDISEEMLAIAAGRGSADVALLCKDITLDAVEVEGVYDLITAFRFFSNADDSLRCAALLALRHRMHDESILIANTHTNPLSYKALMWPVHELRRACGRRVHARYLTRARLRGLLTDAGLTVVAEYGCGFVPARFCSFLGRRVALAIERVLVRVPLLQQFGVNQFMVCRRAASVD